MPSDFIPVGVEAIAYQSTKFYDELTDLVEQYRKAGIYSTTEAAKIGIPKLIEDYTGMSVRIDVEDSWSPNAMIRIPDMDKNHPMLNNFYRGWFTNNDMHTISKMVNDKFTGIIDRKNAKVAGHFSKITAPMYLTTAILKSEKFTSREVTAIMLHELGHLYTYFERIIDLVSINYAAWSAAERIMKTEQDTDRVVILTEFSNAVDANLIEKETLAKLDGKEVIFTHLVCETVKNRRNEEGDMVYSYRGYEFSSDQFAVRHGAGSDLAIALDKVYRAQFINPSYLSWPTHVAIQSVSFLYHLLMASSGFVGTLFTALVLLAARPMNKTYDDPRQRMERIKREMVGELKLKLSDERRRQLVQDVEAIDTMMVGVKDKAEWLEAVWKYLLPAGRSSQAKMEFQQTLERLANNNLFLQAARLDNLA